MPAKKHLLPPDVRMDTNDGLVKQPSSHLGCRIWAWPRLSWPEETRRIHTKRRGQSGNASIFVLCWYSLETPRSADSRLLLTGLRKEPYGRCTIHTKTDVVTWMGTAASFFKAVIMKYIWCSKENVCLLRLMRNHTPK